MIAGFKHRIAGKFQAANTLLEFVRHLSNWRSVWRSYRAGHVTSPLLLRNGIRLEFGPDDDAIQVFREVFVRKCYSPTWFYTPRPGDAVLDLGANIGVFSLAVANLGARCHSFEPALGTRTRLLQNVAVNRLPGSITVYPYGIGGSAEKVTLKAGSSSIHASIYANDQVSEAPGETIELIPMADALQRTGETAIDLLKVDIEGAEKALFEHSPPEVFKTVRRVVLEFHDHFRPGARQVAEKTLAAAGMKIVRVEPSDETGLCGILYAVRA